MKQLLGRLFARKPEAGGGEAQTALAEPVYYEVWGSLESANRALWAALWLATTVALLSLLLVRLLLSRPPVVIRVDGQGQAQAVADAGRSHGTTEPEIAAFVTLFEQFFTELNCYTYDADLRRAFAMMTQSFQSKANDMLKRDAIVENLKASQTKTALTLTEIKVVRDTPEIVQCRVKGFRAISSYKPDQAPGEVVFEDDIVLRKVPRSKNAPYGLLIEDFNESLFKR